MNEPANPTVPLSVRVCLGCFSGQIFYPLLRPDQGIDFFPDQSIMMQVHRCSGRRDPLNRNIWKEVVLRLPEVMYDRILADPAVRRGESRIHPDWRRSEG